MEPWPQELERPDTSPDASNGIRHGPCSATSGVSEASHKRGHPIRVVDGLASQPLISTFALQAGCSPTWVKERGPEQSRD
jgi:hypothetical protein